MTATKMSDMDFNVQVLNDAIQGVFGSGKGLVTALQATGACTVDGTMPHGSDMIGNEVTVPRFGVIGEFADNPEDTAATPAVLKMTNEKSSVSRGSLAFEVSRWRRGAGAEDPYKEATRQIIEAGSLYMTDKIVAAAAATPLVVQRYSASVPVYMGRNLIIDAASVWGDQALNIAAVGVHSRTLVDLEKLSDSNGHPLLVPNDDVLGMPRFGRFPLLISDRLPLTGSSMGAVTSAGTTPPTLTLSGTPKGAYDMRFRIIGAGARGTFTFQFSTNGGGNWSATVTSAASNVLTDTASDSLVGVNGATGITAAWANAAAATDNTYSATALLKATSLVIAKGALGFWYNANALAIQSDKDILKDNDVAAAHLYNVPILYKRARGLTLPGVSAITHNLGSYIG